MQSIRVIRVPGLVGGNASPSQQGTWEVLSLLSVWVSWDSGRIRKGEQRLEVGAMGLGGLRLPKAFCTGHGTPATSRHLPFS